MLALSFTFLAGRYHATPWERHVNEGAVAWPPAPWRLLRALVATWHHKVKHSGRHTEATLAGLIEALADELPEYALPRASHSHTRHYMPQFATNKANNTKLVVDAFAAIRRDEPLTVIWPTLDLPQDQRDLLDDLLVAMGYLGRAESWVEARRVEDHAQPNCRPGSDALDTTTGELHGETITLFAPLPNDTYAALREHFLPDKKAAKKLGKTLPDTLLAALSVDTAALRKQGWNQPPAARKVSYLRPINALIPERRIHRMHAPRVITASFIVTGKPLPRVEDTLSIGELMRMAVMSQAKYADAFGPSNVPSIFSGHDLPAGNRHGHAFFLPWDSDNDGRIDRVVLHVADGMDTDQQHLITRIHKLWNPQGGEWGLVLENMGDTSVGGPMTASNTTWESVTPYLHPWHSKEHFSVVDQIRRECRERGLPEPVAVESLETIDVGKNRQRRTIHFKRFRNKRGLHQPDRLGSFWRLTFAEPISGPLALGFACHYGLGLFRPPN